MAAVNGAPGAEDEFDELVRGAQDRLRRAEELARLADDPATEGYRALGAHLEVLAGHHRLEKQRINTQLEVIDGRLDEIHEIHTELRDVAAAAATAAKAELGKTQAELARQAGQQIAAYATRQLKTMTRISWLRAVSAAVAVGVVAFVTGAALGVAWGGSATARRLATADAVVHFVAAKEGLPAVRDWDTLMRLNPIETLLASCTGANIAVENGRKGCHLWLWIEPPAVTTPNAKG
jgi:hypothetical protein